MMTTEVRVPSSESLWGGVSTISQAGVLEQSKQNAEWEEFTPKSTNKKLHAVSKETLNPTQATNGVVNESQVDGVVEFDLESYSHSLPGPLKAIIQSTRDRASGKHETFSIEMMSGDFKCNTVSTVAKSFMVLAALGVLTWFGLLALVYWRTPTDAFVNLGQTEHYVAILAGALILTSMVTKITPLVANKGANLLTSGLIICAVTIQLIAALTDIGMAMIKTPVLVDQITGSLVYPLRWCEWTVLAFMMTYLTEGVHYPEQNMIPRDHKESTPLTRLVNTWKLLKWPFLMGLSQGLSTVCGLLFPYCSSNLKVWLALMISSCVAYTMMFPRLLYKRDLYLSTKKGTSVEEIEFYDRVRLSYELLRMCTIVWTVLVMSYFIGAFSWWFVPEGHLLRNPLLSFICEAVIDVLAKGFYLDVIVDVHKLVFDDRERVARRLEELRKLMTVVWECSSDVISISVKSPINGLITTMLSPTFHNVDDVFLREMVQEKGKHKTQKQQQELLATFKTRPIIFEMTDPSRDDETSKAQPRLRSVYSLDITDTGSTCYRHSTHTLTAKSQPVLYSIKDLMLKTWALDKSEKLQVHGIRMRNGKLVQCEASATRLGSNALVVVMRDITERFKCFEAEKKAVSEATARLKDAEANRFTRHEVKNGLLASIGLCDSLREVFAKTSAEHDLANEEKGAVRIIMDLDSTLRDVLDTVLAETLARDVIHEVYEPKVERVDLISVLTSLQGKDSNRFPVVAYPSPLPIFLFDPQLLKYIHRNAVSNACKYGKSGGVVVTEVHFDSVKNEIEINVNNFPGEHHDRLVKLGSEASEAVFAPGRRLHSSTDLLRTSESQRKHSSGDGAWISQKCAKTLGGSCSISFEPDKTVFTLRCPATPHSLATGIPGAVPDLSKFQLPEDTWAVAIDDSKIQRKLMSKFFSNAGIPKDRQVVLGETVDEIRGFIDILKKLIRDYSSSHFLVIVDENLDIVEDRNHCHTVSGSLCIQKLCNELDPEDEKRVLAVVRSANDSAADTAIYKSRTHGFICKAPIQREKIIETIAPLWARRFTAPRGSTNSMLYSRRPSFDSDKSISMASEIMQMLEVIDALCSQNHSYLGARWQLIWEKLDKLRHDLRLLELTQNDMQVLDAIGSLEGPTLPVNFLAQWAEIRSQIIRFI